MKVINASSGCIDLNIDNTDTKVGIDQHECYQDWYFRLNLIIFYIWLLSSNYQWVEYEFEMKCLMMHAEKKN